MTIWGCFAAACVESESVDAADLQDLESQRVLELDVWPRFRGMAANVIEALEVLESHVRLLSNLSPERSWELRSMLLVIATTLAYKRDQKMDFWVSLNLSPELSTSDITDEQDTTAFRNLFVIVTAVWMETLYCRQQNLPTAVAVVELAAFAQLFAMGFTSFEHPNVRRVCMPLCGPPIWLCLPEVRRTQLVTVDHPSLARTLSAVQQKFADQEAVRRAKLPAIYARGMPDILALSLSFLTDEISELKMQPCLARFDYFERFIELCVCLVTQLPTRRIFRPVLLWKQTVVRLRHSAYFDHQEGAIFRKLLKILMMYEFFEVDDESGSPLSEQELLSRHYARVEALQLWFFENRETYGSEYESEMLKASSALIQTVETPEAFRRLLSKLPSDAIPSLLSNQGICSAEVVREISGGHLDMDVMKEILVHAYEKRESQLTRIMDAPLYPTERTLFDSSVVPSDVGSAVTVGLPQLHLQFLSTYDYLYRNFVLYRAESAFAIREDLTEVVYRMSPYCDANGFTQFQGSHRMALPISLFAVLVVKKPNIDSNVPSEVRAELVINLKNVHPRHREEWDQLKQHDVLFLLGCTARHSTPSAVKPPEFAGRIEEIPETYGIACVRGCEIVEVVDEEGNVISDRSRAQEEGKHIQPVGYSRTIRIRLDPAQFSQDAMAAADGSLFEDIYTTLNLVVRRRPEENNFKAVLSTVGSLMLRPENTVVPGWLMDLFLGYGDPEAAVWPEGKVRELDYADTFLDLDHLRSSFPTAEVQCPEEVQPPYRVCVDDDEDGKPLKVSVHEYRVPARGPFPECRVRQNQIRFTPAQVEAIRSGVSPGLTLIVGPPGTGKTDTAVQIVSVLLKNYPQQRTLVVASSNQALNDLFAKICELDVDERHLLRLGVGESELRTADSSYDVARGRDFSKWGRVNHMLQRRLLQLERVDDLARLLGIDGEWGASCETATYFQRLHVDSRIRVFREAMQALTDSQQDVEDTVRELGDIGQKLADNWKSGSRLEQYGNGSISLVDLLFPFHAYFHEVQPLFSADETSDLEVAETCFRFLEGMFAEVQEYHPLELLRTMHLRTEYMITHHAKVIAMTCTHAALQRDNLVRMGFSYDNVVMEESAQMLEVQTFIPFVLQEVDPEQGSKLERIIMIGDHHQLAPVVRNRALQTHCNLDRSMFHRLIQLRTPFIQLDRQGRCRADLARLFAWRYTQPPLQDLPVVQSLVHANAGLQHTYQFVDVGATATESCPSPYFYQNLEEAEFVVATYMYLRLIGHPASSISIITTYKGQRQLLHDLVEQQCAWNPAIGWPASLTTVDRFQGRQNGIVLVSLVRTRHVGHIRDVRRLIVTVSRARLGLLTFGKWELFSSCFELGPVMKQFANRPVVLELLPEEEFDTCTRRVDGQPGKAVAITSAGAMRSLIQKKVTDMLAQLDSA